MSLIDFGDDDSLLVDKRARQLQLQQAEASRSSFFGAPTGISFGATCGALLFGATYVSFHNFNCGPQTQPYYNMGSSFVEDKEQLKKNKKAENKAILLMQNIIGSQQCDVYRKTYRVIVKPSKWFWVIGNVFDSYHEENPFYSKPDVIRVDNPKKLHITYFCVDQKGGGPTPYTDKVITFTAHLMNNEKSFVRTINRLGEKTLDEMPECALYS